MMRIALIEVFVAPEHIGRPRVRRHLRARSMSSWRPHKVRLRRPLPFSLESVSLTTDGHRRLLGRPLSGEIAEAGLPRRPPCPSRSGGAHLCGLAGAMCASAAAEWDCWFRGARDPMGGSSASRSVAAGRRGPAQPPGRGSITVHVLDLAPESRPWKAHRCSGTGGVSGGGIERGAYHARRRAAGVAGRLGGGGGPAGPIILDLRRADLHFP